MPGIAMCGEPGKQAGRFQVVCEQRHGACPIYKPMPFCCNELLLHKIRGPAPPARAAERSNTQQQACTAICAW